MEEVWKNVAGFSYSVSNLGNVYSHISHKILTPRTAGNGYVQISLHGQGRPMHQYVHRLVACAFLLNPENKPEVNHKNGIKTDNRAENLEWATSSENKTHAYAAGLKTASMPNYRGAQLPQTKLSESDVLSIRERHATGELQNRMAAEYGVNPVTIWSIVHRRNWKHI